MLLNISNIQHFSVSDGPGIRTTIFFKGCNLRCPWCHNPENLSAAPVIMDYLQIGKQEISGRKVTCEEVLEELLKDRDFYETSGGGITFSGGEVLLQAESVSGLAEMIAQQGLSLMVDTAGCVPYSAFERMNPWTEAYLYDFKTASPSRFAEVIGGDWQLMFQNLERLLSDGKKVFIRIPLIPGFNTDDDSAEAICAQLKQLGIQAVDLLPFHSMGSGKYAALGMDYAYRDTPSFRGEALHRVESIFSQYFNVHTEE